MTRFPPRRSNSSISAGELQTKVPNHLGAVGERSIKCGLEIARLAAHLDFDPRERFPLLTPEIEAGLALDLPIVLEQDRLRHQ